MLINIIARNIGIVGISYGPDEPKSIYNIVNVWLHGQQIGINYNIYEMFIEVSFVFSIRKEQRYLNCNRQQTLQMHD